MLKIILSTIVGTIIVFAVQFLSWEVSPIHDHTFKYSEKQDTLLNVLEKNLPGTGVYALPFFDPDKKLSKEEEEEFQKQRIGKPWAMVYYHQSLKDMMVTQLMLGILFTLLSVLIITVILVKAKSLFPTFWSRFALVVSFLLFLLLQSTFTEWNWFSLPSHYVNGEIIDHCLAWGCCGVWLAWFTGR